MPCLRHCVCLLCLGLLLPALARAEADEPLASEIEPGPSCRVSADGELPRVPSQITVGRRAVEAAEKRHIRVLNTHGYGYQIPGDHFPAKPAPEVED